LATVARFALTHGSTTRGQVILAFTKWIGWRPSEYRPNKIFGSKK
jgi:hypothetical protein